MKKQTLITRNLVNIPLDHVLSFKTEKAFQEAMETEGHFDNELPEVRAEIVESIWKEAKELSAADEEAQKATAPKAKHSGNAKAPVQNTTSETGAPGGGPATAAAAPSGTTTTAPVK